MIRSFDGLDKLAAVGFWNRVTGGIALFALALLAGCNSSDVAGTSSGVDNPQIVVAFTSSAGTPQTISGTLSIYQADQNPTVNPDPILDTLINSSTSVHLSRSDFITSGDSGGVFNILLISNDSTGGLLQRIVYNPTTKKFSSGDGGAAISQTSLPLAHLVPYSSSIKRADQDGPERVFIPGTPFQSVVVDSDFTFTQIPPGVFPLHLLTNQGVELPLLDSLNTHTMAPPPHRVDTGAPINRPPPPPPPPNLKADAGVDKTVFKDAENFLSGTVMGADPKDPRLAVLWRQINPDPQTTRAQIERPDALKTHVTFPAPGSYRFVLWVAYGNEGKSEDTVQFTVQSASAPANNGQSVHPR